MVYKIINSFQDINWIQIGRSNEPRLSNCLHLNLKLCGILEYIRVIL